MNLLLVIGVFALLLVAFGGGMGGVEVGIWAVAQLAAIISVILRYMRQRRLGQTPS
ncbi:hypothetical protein AB0E77_05400 [Streptomyces sp. NPDC032940]|uniref:hypothetical protein n=1 Tax=Streptomyces sp. NPDC032940 TaxID=3155366 RepID=UPI003405249C